MWLGWTMLMIPYYAWAAELSPDYNERTRITGWRAVFGRPRNDERPAHSVSRPGAVQLWGHRQRDAHAGRCSARLIPVCCGLTVLRVPEFPEVDAPAIPLFSGLKIMWKNGPFRRLVLGFVLSSTGLAIVMPLYIFFVEFILESRRPTCLT